MRPNGQHWSRGLLADRTIAVVVPAFNEARLIAGMLTAIPEFVDHIIVVDDASSDGTREAARTVGRPIELLAHRTNRGVGAAIATGCKHALALGAEYTAIMAADGQMDPDDLPALLAPLVTDEADYVKGNRLASPGAWRRMPWHRWVGNHVFSSLTRYALGVDVQDSQCGYAAMNQHVKRTLEWDNLWKTYGYPNDLLGWLTLGGMRVRDVPVRPVYGAEQSGIRLHHVMWIIPFVIARAGFRRRASRRRGSGPHARTTEWT